MTLQNPADFEFDTGLEDFDFEDAVTPRIQIVHREGLFKDSLSGQTYDKLTTILLGLVKQRILWHKDVDEGDYPMCRSANHDTGFPNLSDKVPVGKQFPWDKAGFNPANYPEGQDGLVRLPCDKCQLKEWGSHPDGNKPYCAEQFTIPLLYDPNGDREMFVPAILSFQKTSLKPLKAYLTGFQQRRNAPFMALTEIGLDMQKRGSNEYSVPNFRKVGDTDQDMWRNYSTQYRQLREFLTLDPGAEDLDSDTPTEPVTTEDSNVVDAEIVEEEAPRQAPAAPQAPKGPSAPQAPAAPSSSDDDDDDLPF